MTSDRPITVFFVENRNGRDASAICCWKAKLVFFVKLPWNIVSQAAGLIAGSGSEESQEAGQLLAVGCVLVDAQFQILAKLFVEFLISIFVLVQFIEKFHALFNEIFADDFQNLVLLKGFTRNVQWQIFRINNSLKIRKSTYYNIDIFL